MAYLKVLFCAFALIQLCSGKFSYENYKVYDVTPTKEQGLLLMDWELREGIDFWSHLYAGHTSKIMVSPDMHDEFVEFLTSLGIANKLSIENVETTLNSVRPKTRKRRDVDVDFAHFWTYDEFESYVAMIVDQYPTLVTKVIIGKSIEGRDLIGLKISRDAEFGNQPIIFMESGTHAREWAGIMTNLYLLDQLVQHSEENKDILDFNDWVFVPFANPDGFIYSQNEDRLWRKNRHVFNETCIGVDLNRNYPYAWSYISNSCPTTGHPGPYALSEPEVEANANFLLTFKYNLRLYLTVHTYGDLVLSPFGFKFDQWVSNWKEHAMVAHRYADAVEAALGTPILVGNSADILYTASGCSDDFAIAKANANLAYTLELTTGSDFRYPEDRIEELVKGTFMGLREFGLYIAETYNYLDL